MSIRARMLTTDPESTSRNFLLIGTSRSSDAHVQAVHLDFTQIFSRQCELIEDDDEKSDFEKWYARDLTDGPDCLMGHEQMFYRRKADRDCYVGRDFQDPVSELKECPCTEADYECDYNFVRDQNGKCVRIGPDRIPEGICKSKDDTYPGSSGYRLIPGNTCDQSRGKKLDEPVEQSCKDVNEVPSPQLPGLADPPEEGGEIRHYTTVFNNEVAQFTYFQDSSVVLLRLYNGELWRSPDHGMGWERLLRDTDPVQSFVLHEFDNARAYAILKNEIYSTEDRGVTWTRMQVPLPPSRSAEQVLDFHPQERDWLLFIGDALTMPPHAEVFFSTNHGESWESLDMWVEKCIFGRDPEYEIQKETIYCSGYDGQQLGQDIKFLRTVDWGVHKEVLFDNVIDFFVVEDFMAVASSREGDLMLYVSLDGHNFAEAQFPPNQYVDRNVSKKQEVRELHSRANRYQPPKRHTQYCSQQHTLCS